MKDIIYYTIGSLALILFGMFAGSVIEQRIHSVDITMLPIESTNVAHYVWADESTLDLNYIRCDKVEMWILTSSTEAGIEWTESYTSYNKAYAEFKAIVDEDR